MSGSSSAASNSGEKWLTHITAANSTQATTGKARKRIDPRMQDGQDPAPPAGGEDDAQEQGDRRARAMSGAATSVSSTCWTMWIENSVVS